jgi:hypothetical protein
LLQVALGAQSIRLVQPVPEFQLLRLHHGLPVDPVVQALLVDHLALSYLLPRLLRCLHALLAGPGIQLAQCRQILL